MIQVRNLRLAPGFGEAEVRAAAAKKLRIPEKKITQIRLLKKSLDARKKPNILYTVSVAVTLRESETAVLSKNSDADVASWNEPNYEIPAFDSSRKRPVVVGFGPAGMLAALVLSRAGARPIVLERGKCVEERTKDVEQFREGGPLNPESNVQFGEGGAGTFSDGKLNTGTHDKRIWYVLKTFHEAGAPENILYDAKPHIGTDILVHVVKKIREEVIQNGGEIRFSSKLTALQAENGKLTGAVVQAPEGSYSLKTDDLILAIGHSARETFEELLREQIPMERKAFSMGARIEHLQKDINISQYGSERKDLPAADYSLSVHLPDGDSAYSFCMCPGGYVFAAASEEGRVCTNGMSYSSRNGKNANAALLVTLHPEDFPGEGVLAGMNWQREIESKAYQADGGSYFAVSQRVGDFLRGKSSTEPGKVLPTYQPGVIWGNLDDILPQKITGVMRKALPELDKKLRGFADSDAVLTAPETRSSSPVRILRGENCQSQIRGLYPCGEGAGYAGGITSSAVDGMRCAEALLARRKEGENENEV